MATSGSTSFNTTEASIIEDALLIVGAIDQDEAIPASDYAKARRMLNMLTQFLATKTSLWVRFDITHTLTPGKQSYTVGKGLEIDTPRPLRLEQVRRTDGVNEIPSTVVSRQEYMDLPNKATQSACLQAYYDPQLSNGILYCWPTGTANNDTIILTFKRPLEDFLTSSNNPDFPKEWQLPLVTLLAEKLAPSYLGAVPQWLQVEAAMMMRTVIDWDEEDVDVQFEPGQR